MGILGVKKVSWWKRNWLYVAVAVISLSSFGLYICRFIGYKLSSDPADFGVFGDYIGGVTNGIVGILSVIFVYKAYMLQQETNRSQEKQIKRQQFESTFFTMTAHQREILNGISVKGSDGTDHDGLDAMSALRQKVTAQMNELKKDRHLLSKEYKHKLKNKVHDLYEPVFTDHAAQIGHYFRHLYHILNFAREEWGENSEEWKRYASILQAQMSTDELYLIAVNGISVYGRRKLLPLLNESSFLENLLIDDDDEKIMKLVEIFYPNTKIKNFTHEKPNIIFIGGTDEELKHEIAIKIKEDYPDIITISRSILPIQDRNKTKFSAMISNIGEFKKAYIKNIDPDKLYLLVDNFCERINSGERERQKPSLMKNLNIALLVRVDNHYPSRVGDDIWVEDEYDHSQDIADILERQLVELEYIEDYPSLSREIAGIIKDFE